MRGAGLPLFIIFDCDGVLIDSEVLACRNGAECLTEFGFPITTEEILARFLGRSGASMRMELEAQFGRAIPDEVSNASRQRLKRLYEAELRAMPGIVEMLDRLTVPACVASSSTPDYLDFSLRLVGLFDRFAPNIFSATMVTHGKPAPDLFLLAAERCGFRPQDCLVIEDSPAGVQGAIAAGMAVLGFTGGSHCRADHGDSLRLAGAQDLFCSFAEPPPLLAAALTPVFPVNERRSIPSAAPARPG